MIRTVAAIAGFRIVDRVPKFRTNLFEGEYG